MQRDSSSWVVVFAFVIVVIVVTSIILPKLFQSPPPILEILSCSLNKERAKADEVFYLTFKVKNNDKNSHFMRVEFESHVLVGFYIGDQLLPKDEGKWYFTTNLTPTATLEQPIGVKASLEKGVAEISYSIVANFYVDGNQVYSKELKITIEK
jgi:hypothetical protein